MNHWAFWGGGITCGLLWKCSGPCPHPSTPKSQTHFHFHSPCSIKHQTKSGKERQRQEVPGSCWSLQLVFLPLLPLSHFSPPQVALFDNISKFLMNTLISLGFLPPLTANAGQTLTGFQLFEGLACIQRSLVCFRFFLLNIYSLLLLHPVWTNSLAFFSCVL